MAPSMVELTSSSGEKFGAYLAAPGAAAGSAIVLLQEIFGINGNMRAIADDYAARGYIAIAPDLFWRQQRGVELDPASAADRERAMALMKGLDQQLAVEDALAAASYVRKLPGASGRVGAVGYCLGGKLAYLLATQPGIDAAVSYYGVAIQGALDKAASIRCPLLIHIAQADHLCPPEAQAAIKGAVAPLGNLVTVLEYPNVGHAFARKGGPSFDGPAAERADLATAEFFAARLQAAGGQKDQSRS